MSAASIVLALLKVVSALLDHIERRRILSEGEARAIRTIQEDINEKIKRAAAARTGVDHSAASVSADRNNRDNWTGD